MASDQELRERILRQVYKVRHNNPPYITLPDGLNMKDVNENTLLGILNQLKERNLVKWSRIAGGLVRGRVQITDRGIQEIERADTAAPAQGTSASQSADKQPIVTLKPTLWGMSVDLRLLWKRLFG
jgi:hypothetical protein